MIRILPDPIEILYYPIRSDPDYNLYIKYKCSFLLMDRITRILSYPTQSEYDPDLNKH